MRSRPRVLDALGAGVLAVVLLGPVLLHRGFALRGDMVFVPHQPWKPGWLGLDGAVPRFVPGDAVVWLLEQVLPGDLLQKGVLLGALVVGATGAARLVGDRTALARAAAMVLFLWNPWVYERLAIGQWGVLVGYLVLPWTALAAVRFRDDARRGWPGLALVLGVGALLSPASALLGLVVALGLVVVRPRWTTVVGVVGTWLVVDLPWIAPSLLVTRGLSSTGDQFAGFTARAESPAGALASVLSLGGIWKTSVVPPERTSALIVLGSVVLSFVGVAGAVVAARRGRDETRLVRGLGVVAALSVLIALLPSYARVSTALDRAATTVPALGLVRDSQRYLAPAVLLLAVGVATLVDLLVSRTTHERWSLGVVAVALVLWPVVLLPSAAWGFGGLLHPVRYPAEWSAVREVLPEGRTVVLPWRGTYRGFAWNERRAVLDPADRFLPGEVLIDDRVFLRDRVIGSEDPLLRSVGRALDGPDPVAALRDLGVRSLLVEKGNGAREPDLAAATELHDGAGLALYDLGPVTAPTSRRAHVGLVVAADVVTVLVVLLAFVLEVARRRRRPV